VTHAGYSENNATAVLSTRNQDQQRKVKSLKRKCSELEKVVTNTESDKLQLQTMHEHNYELLHEYENTVAFLGNQVEALSTEHGKMVVSYNGLLNLYLKD
jgi:predicted RNase H-like nuclease (RuvC/YqgF family)